MSDSRRSRTSSRSSDVSTSSTLTRAEIENVLESPVETGYTYSESKAYKRSGSMDFTHPRMGRRPIKFRNPKFMPMADYDVTSSIGRYSSDRYYQQPLRGREGYVAQFWAWLLHLLTLVLTTGQQLGAWILERPLTAVYTSLTYNAVAVRDGFVWLLRLPMEAVYYLFSGSSTVTRKGQNLSGWVLDKPLAAMYRGVSYSARTAWDSFLWLLRLPMEGAYYLLRGSATSVEKGQTLGGWMLDKPFSSLYNGASYLAGKVRDASVFVLQLPARSYTEVTRYFSPSRTPKRTTERVTVHEEERTLRVGPYAYERQDLVRKTPYALRNRGTHVAHYDKTTEVTREIKPVRDWSSFWYFWLPLLLALLLGSFALLAMPRGRGNWTRYDQPCEENAVECAKQWVYNKAAETWEYMPDTPSLEDYSFAHYLTGYSTNATVLGRARAWAYRQGSNLSYAASNIPHKLWTSVVDIAFRVIHVFSGVSVFVTDKMGDTICTGKEIAMKLLKLPLRAVQFVLDGCAWIVINGAGAVRDAFFWLLRLPMDAIRYTLSRSAAAIEKGEKVVGRVIEKPVTAVYESVGHGAGAVRDGFVWLLRLPAEGIHYLHRGSAAAIEKVWDAVIWTLNAPLVVLDKTGGLVANGVKAAYTGGRNALRTIPTGTWWLLRQARDFGEWIVSLPLRVMYWVGGHAIAGAEKGKDLVVELLKLPLRAVQVFLNGGAWIIEKGQRLGGWILDHPLGSVFKGLSYGAGAVRDGFLWLLRLPMKGLYYFLSESAAAVEKGQKIGGWVLDKPVAAVSYGIRHGARAVRDGFVWLLRLPMEGIYYLLSGSAAAIEKGQKLGGWVLDKPGSSLYNGASYVAGKARDAGVFVFQLPLRALYFLLSGSAAAIEKGQQIGGWLLDHPLYYLQAAGNKALGGGYWVADSVRGLGHYFVRSFSRFVLAIGRFFSGGGSTERPRTVVPHEERYVEKETESYHRGASEKESESYQRGASQKEPTDRLEGVTEDHPIIQRLQRMFYSLLNEQNDQLEKRLRTVIEDKVGGVRTDFDSQMLHLRDSYEEQVAHLQKELIEKHNAAVKDEMGKLLGIIREEISAKSFHEQEQGKSLEVAGLRDEINALKAQLAEKSKGLESGIEQRVENIIIQLNQQQENRFKIYQAQMEKKIGTETDKPDHLLALARIQSEIDSLKDELKSVGLAATSAQAAADIAVGLDAKIAAILDKLMSSERKAIQLELEQLEKRMSEKTSKANATAATGAVPKKGTDAEVEKKLAEFMSSVNERITTQSSKLLDELQVIRRNYNEHKLDVLHEHHVHLDDDALMTKFRAIVKEALDRYDMDKTGLPDYALESSGGAVVSTRCTVQYKETSRRESILGFPLWYSSYSPRSVIQRKSHGATPGECWAFVGGQGYLTVRLSKRLNVTAVSYEHLPVQMSPEGHINTAPKDFLVWSYQHENDLDSKFFLGSFTYNADGDALQMFPMQHVDPKGTPVIELETLSNYGAPVTCLYRFRVHGNITQTQP